MTQFLDAEPVSVTITGSGGAGAITAGQLLLEAAGRTGLFGLMTRSVGPQIRGGEAAAMLRLAAGEVAAHGDRTDLLVALDWGNVERFAAEIPLDSDSLVLADADAGPVPAVIAAAGAREAVLPFARLAKAITGGRANIVALGAAAALLGLDPGMMAKTIAAGLGRKGIPAAAAEAVAAGHQAALKAGLQARRLPVGPPGLPGSEAHGDAAGDRWLLSGNQAAGLGALRAGLRFVAAYPITPATDMLEWLAPRLPRLGGTLVQAEDEIAALSMVIGASQGGLPSMTATSGPGLALMSESLGLAVAAEIPLVVVNVTRGGPSTGIPTKSEQSDLDIALGGLHGDAPHLVLAPLSVADCAFTTQWALCLAEALQVPAIVLGDQFLGQALSVVPAIPDDGRQAARLVPDAPGRDYRRYALTDTGVSPMALPGQRGTRYTADGLEHDERGTPSSRADDHAAQLDKRARKLTAYDFGDAWAEIDGAGEGDTAVVTWGSTAGAAREAVRSLRADGHAVRLVALRLLAPAPSDGWARAMAGCRRALIVEQSHGHQFERYLKAHLGLPAETASLARPGPLPIRPAEIRAAIERGRCAGVEHGRRAPP